MFSFVFLPILTYIHIATADVPSFYNSEEYQFAEFGPYPRQHFFSDPDVVGPVANIITSPQDGVALEKLVTWSPHGSGIPELGPQLLDTDTLSVVWQGPRFAEDNFGATKQNCNGSDYLVWWSGTNIDGRAAGHYYIFNSTYHNVWNVSSIGLKKADAHDIFVTPDCHAIITVNEPKPFELEDAHLADNAWLQESYFQEIDLATNELVFQWRASDHIDFHYSRWLPNIGGDSVGWQGIHKQDSWDFFHINSVEKDHTGNYLVSARHMNALYYVDGMTGKVKWQLGGHLNQFEDLSDGYATDFAWQHHARWANEDLNLISVFDDRNCRYIKSADPISRGALISLDFEHMTASLAGNYRAPSHIESFRKGGMQVLDNGNVLLGFGNEPAFTEYAADGSILWDVRMGPVMAGFDRETADNYRSYKMDWVGKPYWSPKIAAGPKLNKTEKIIALKQKHEKTQMELRPRANDTAYFSWNGATELRKWMLFAADHPLELDSMANLYTTINKTGFETEVYLGANTTRYVRAVAVAEDDEFLGATPILDMRDGSQWQNTAELLKAQKSQWSDVEETADLDPIVAAALEYDSLATLKQEWDALRHKGEHKPGIMGLSLLLVITAFAALGWVGWRSLRRAFDRKYLGKYATIQDLEDGVGVDGKNSAVVVDTEMKKDVERRRLEMSHAWGR